MKIGNIIIWIILFIFLSNSCVEEYWPELRPKYENSLVIDGKITNDPGPYEIRLSLSSSVERPLLKPYTGCSVVIYDDKGYQEKLEEITVGVYQTKEDGIIGACGNSYRITIITPDGKVYGSDFEKMPIPTEIDTIYSIIEYQSHPILDRGVTGFRFLIDTYVSEVDTNYYLWDIESTYKFHANYLIKYYFDGSMHRFFPSDSLYTCYKTDKIPEIYIYNTANLSVPEVTRFPINYVTTETKELSIRYSLLVNQYSLSEEAYHFWDKIKNTQDEQGELHFKQPFQVRGNVYNVENREEQVLGYFMAAGISKKRIFMDRPTGVDWHYSDSCNLYPVDNNILWAKINEWPLYFPAVNNGPAQGPAWVDYQWCVDCTAKGLNGYLEKPEFWVEN